MEFARNGDIIVVWRLDRLSRSLKDLIDVVSFLELKGIGLKSIHEFIDTTSSSERLIFHIFGALAEFEKNIIRERTHAGLKAARGRGKIGGRPRKLNNDKVKLANNLYNETKMSINQICELLDVSKPTLYKYLAK
ncbi:recombinase family protein [Legionella moravica]|uniref:recombinase family protein n=1 Tax=Legionella moravica TaxID=39962 RepID=UPI003D157CC3